MKPTGWKIEEVQPEKRRSLSAKEKLDVLKSHPHCPVCRTAVGVNDAEWDHQIPLELGGSNEVENFRGLHPDCHKIKTRQDVKSIAKARRIRKKRLGLAKPKKAIPSRPFAKRKKRERLSKHQQVLGRGQGGDAPPEED
jgi:5-methylcytosine-specific restriction endonuclease McrA